MASAWYNRADWLGVKHQVSYFEGSAGRAVTESERKTIPDLCSREAKGTISMLFSLEDGDAKSSIVRRRAQRPRRDLDLDKFSQVLRMI